MKRLFCVFLWVLVGGSASAQKRSNIWVFGDSTGIDFNVTPSIFNSSLDTRGTSISIADTSGSLLFYANTRASVIKSTQVWNNLHQLIQNGDSINGQGWYHELIILPDPGNDSLYYLFSICVTNSCPYGLYYSVINMKANGGLGEVIQKNIPLQNFPMVDCLTAVKHGNGRDWWLIFRRWDWIHLDPNNEFHSYLISPAGITNYNVQMIGESHSANSGQITFSPDGTKLVFTNLSDLIEIFDFNRCNGILSNTNIINFTNPPQYATGTWSSAFSSNSNFLYLSTSNILDTCYLMQLDLTSPNIFTSRVILDTFYTPPVLPGSLKLAPNGKIYLSCAYWDGVTFNYPYNSSEYDSVNMYLSVINYPDSLGTACNYEPFSFYLGGKRTYWGLPNNPDYDLPALAGSPCDTLVSIAEAPQMQQTTINVFYHTVWEKAFINASNLKGKNGKLLVYDMQGKIIHQEPLRIQNGYYTRDLSMQGKAHGVYLVIVQTEEEHLARKMIAE